MPSLAFPEVGQLTANLPHVHLVAGQVLTNATTPTRKRGKGFSVSKPGTGRYLITLNKRVGFVIAAVGTLRKVTGGATFLTGPIVADNNTVEFRVENASGTAADAPDAANIDFIIVCTKTKLSVV